MIISASLRVQRLSWSRKNMRASCWLKVEAPCSLRPWRMSTYAALTMRTGSKPACWKKCLSSAEVTACTSTGGISANLTSRRFSRAGAGEVGDELRLQLVLIARSVVLQRDDLRYPAARELQHRGLLVEVGLRTREDFDLVGRIW